MKNLIMMIVTGSLLLGTVSVFANTDTIEVAQSDKLKAKLKAKAEAAAKKAKQKAVAKKEAVKAEAKEAAQVAAVGDPVVATKGEDAKHARNIARIARLEEIAKEKNNAELLKKVVKLKDIENRRHTKKMAMINKALNKAAK